MQASVAIRGFGTPEVLRLEQVEVPRPSPGDVLIKVLAAGVNRIEHYLRGGSVPPLTFPHVLGSDAAGVAIEVSAPT